MVLQLLGPVGNIHTNLALVTAEFCNVPINHVYVEYKEAMGKEFMKKYPIGIVPILITEEKDTIYTITAIIKYIVRASQKLQGKNGLEETKIDQFFDMAINSLYSAVTDVTNSIYGYKAYDENTVKNGKKQFEKYLKFFNDQLKIDVFLVGQKLSIADIALAGVLHFAFRVAFEEKIRLDNPHCLRHVRYISTLQPFSKYFGRFNTVQKEWEAFKKEGQVKNDNNKKEEQEQKQK
ncbi:hypothetical protein IMG5_137000 [Ichthyophthirius multifiliis]|uniref:GST C-terminal domain-containing protein n=1 Tax=Ichthyophthirius multifiliis TaxID=5932 RepID=G0QX11_ICHMU|nr:hypothetical protein IMG5_137000 [Ichthyophthirius multifiliis]EGR30246.1 hypothetical protein IMG5_137000 [Ichthyophthirius multifiliis]|eukprot:XP_004031842.1 hypothetical protein IMG5_137000 [Ichthyophthirius multifiliis]